MSQSDSEHNTDTPSPHSDEYTAAASDETSQAASRSDGANNASTNETTKGGWYQLDGVPEIREMIFKECLGELDDEIRDCNALKGDYGPDSTTLLPCLDMLHVCKGFVDDLVPLLRKSFDLVTGPWSFNSDFCGEWDGPALQLASLQRVVSTSKDYGLRFQRYFLALEAYDPGGYETAGLLAALARHMRRRAVTGDHNFEGRFKSWWIDWRGGPGLQGEHFFYRRERSDDNPMCLRIDYYGDGGRSDLVLLHLESDAATLDFQDFDWKPTKVVEYER